MSLQLVKENKIQKLHLMTKAKKLHRTLKLVKLGQMMRLWRDRTNSPLEMRSKVN